MLLKDGQPHLDSDYGAHHGQLNLPSDQKMWSELYVSIDTQWDSQEVYTVYYLSVLYMVIT